MEEYNTKNDKWIGKWECEWTQTPPLLWVRSRFFYFLFTVLNFNLSQWHEPIMRPFYLVFFLMNLEFRSCLNRPLTSISSYQSQVMLRARSLESNTFCIVVVNPLVCRLAHHRCGGRYLLDLHGLDSANEPQRTLTGRMDRSSGLISRPKPENNNVDLEDAGVIVLYSLRS